MFESKQFFLQRSIPHSLTTASRSVVMFAPKTKFPSFGAALPFPSTINTNYCFSAILKNCLNLSSSSSAVNTSQLDNCQSFCCHVCSENRVSEFWRRSTLSKYNYYKLLLFCNFKKMFESKQFAYSNQYLTVGQLPVVWLSCLLRKQSFRVLAPLYPFQVQLLQTIAFLQF